MNTLKANPVNRFMKTAKKSLLLALVSLFFCLAYIYADDFQEDTIAEANLIGFSYGSVAWADINNDGKMDFAVCGSSGLTTGGDSANSIRIYRNNGGGTFTVALDITGVYDCSIAWGDYNNDGYPDLLVSGRGRDGAPSTYFTRIYKNSAGTFSSGSNIDFGSSARFDHSRVAWADYNNDGNLDFAVMGDDGSSSYFRMYKNNGDGTFTYDSGVIVQALTQGSIAFGDYNNDGYPDLAISGQTYPDSHVCVTKLYKNNGDGTFTEDTTAESGIRALGNSCLAWGDYNNDGYLDLAILGNDFNPNNSYCRIYKNNGNGTFTELSNTNITDNTCYNGYLAWGDYNNDGYPDLLVSGNSTNPFPGETDIYLNNSGNGTFTKQSYTTAIKGLTNGSVAWGDYNNDRRLDFIVSGSTIYASAGSYVDARIYKNVSAYTLPNLPDAPTGLTASYSSANQRLQLSWNPSVVYTVASSSGLGYEVLVATSPIENNPTKWVVSANHATPFLGNSPNSRIGSNTLGMYINSIGLTSNTTYYWQVRAVDNSFSTSTWSTESSIYLSGQIQPPATVTNLAGTSGTNSGQVKLTWSTPGESGWTGILGSTAQFVIQYSTWSGVSWSTSSALIQVSTNGVSPGTSVNYTATGLTGGTTYYFKIWYMNDYWNWSWPSNPASAQVTGIPAAITNLTSQALSSSGRVTLSWSAPGEDGWTNPLLPGSAYYIQSSTWSAVSWSTATAGVLKVSTSGVSPGTGVSYTVTGLTTGTSYYFSIWHVNDMNRLSNLSNTTTSWTLPFPAAVTNLAATTGSSSKQVNLSWSAPGENGLSGQLASGSSFIIQSSTDSGVSWSTAAASGVVTVSTSGVSPGTTVYYTITEPIGGATYYFKIWHVNDYNMLSSISNTATGWALGIPAAVTNLSSQASSSQGQVNLSWSAPGEDAWTGSLVQGSAFIIQNSSDPAVTWSTAAASGIIKVSTSGVTPGTSVSYSVTGLLTGTSYYFKIWHVNDMNQLSGLSNTTTSWTMPFPAAVTNLSAATGSAPDQVNLSWSAPGENGLSGQLSSGSSFIIQSSTYSGVTWSTAAASGVVSVSTSGVSPGTMVYYTAANLPGGTSYYFKIWHVNDYNMLSSISNTATGWAYCVPATVTNLSATQGSTEGAAKLSWSMPGNDGWTSAFTQDPSKFIIQESSDSSFVAWSTAAAVNIVRISTHGITPGTSTNYSYTVLTAGTTYYFKIWHVNDFNNLSSGLSNSATAWAQVYIPTPASVTNLAALTPMTRRIPLNWSSPSADINTSTTPFGNPSSFTINYSTYTSGGVPITVSTSGVTPGTTVYYTLTSLKSNTSYYMNIMYTNQYGNSATLSSMATGWTMIDSSAPANITTLSAKAGTNNGELALSWNTPGNDGSTDPLGVGSQYAMEYSTYSTISWSTAAPTHVVYVSTSGVSPGTPVSYTLTGLEKSATYYSVIWTMDEAGNWSGLSNVPSTWAKGGLVISGITPNTGTNDGAVSVTISGSGFLSGSQPKLQKSGSTDITATGITVSSSTQITCTFDLTNASSGTWDLSVSTGAISDVLAGGFTITSVVNSAEALIKKDSGGTIAILPESGAITLTIPGGSFSDDVTVTLSTDTPGSSQQQTGIKVINIGLRISNDKGLQPLKGLTIVIKFRDSDVSGVADRTNIVLSLYDETWDRWVPLTTTPGPGVNEVTAVITHFSRYSMTYFSPADNLDTLNVFPNPYKPAINTAGFTIENLTQYADLRLFTISRELVRTIDYSGQTGRAKWDGRNDAGNDVASGVYVLFIKSRQGQKKKMKIIVER